MSISADAINAANQIQVRPQDLLASFRQYQGKIKILSLDCFDTLLWRRTSTPKDIFYQLAQDPLFITHHITASMRITAEQNTYTKHLLTKGHAQATLQEIYRTLKPQLSNEEIDELVTIEVDLEKMMLYAFQPIVALIEEAAHSGCKIIIVSDTYFTKSQLTSILKYCLPNDIFLSISEIFCSCEYDTGKSNNLFNIILKKLKLSPAQILHIGDNANADAMTPAKSGIHTLHLIQYNSLLAEMIRSQSVSASFYTLTQRNQTSSLNYYGGLLAEKMVNNSPAYLIGYAALGPIMHSFATYIKEQHATLTLRGKPPKILFLMRDGYLPSLAFSTLAPTINKAHAHISRFAANASSFRSVDDIDEYLAKNIQSGRYEDMCTQLLLPDSLANIILTKLQHNPQRAHYFNQAIHDEHVINTILSQSQQYHNRFKTYLQHELGIEYGDTIMFVDLGYQGTAQIKLAPVLRDEMNIEMHGCYLLSAPSLNRTSPHHGLLDEQHCDERAISMLVTYIAVLEQMCTLPSNSVINYDETGKPIFADKKIDGKQFEMIKPIHEACTEFVRDAEAHLALTNSIPTHQQRREIAAASLSRLIFLPTLTEINYLSTFKHDVNLGTKEVISLFNIETGLANLKRRSWLYSLKENSKSMRMNAPFELRAANIELSIMLMAQLRFGLEFAVNDLSLRQENIKISIFTATEPEYINFTTYLTHDGYFALLLPIVSQNEIGIHFGDQYRWLEIDSAELIEVGHLYSQSASEFTHDASHNVTVHQMEDKGGGLFECLSEMGTLIFIPEKGQAEKNEVLRVIYRPIVKR